MSEAVELILRYFVAIACGWLAHHGLKDFDSGDMVSAVSTVLSCVVVAAALISRALYKSGVDYVVDRLKTRHKAKLLAAASEIRAEPPVVAPAGATH